MDWFRCTCLSLQITTIENDARNCENLADCIDWMYDLRIVKCCRLHLALPCDAVEPPIEPVANWAIFANQLYSPHRLGMHYSLRLNVVIIRMWRKREKWNGIKQCYKWGKTPFLPLNMEFWYIGSGCNRTCRVASMNANVAKMHASMQPEKRSKQFNHIHTFANNRKYFWTKENYR